MLPAPPTPRFVSEGQLLPGNYLYAGFAKNKVKVSLWGGFDDIYCVVAQNSLHNFLLKDGR